MQRGKIIILNGVSSAGKTTLSKVLQARFPDQYLLFPLDILNEISPQKDSRSYDVRFTVDPKPILSAYFSCVKIFADHGLNVIVDAVFTSDYFNFDYFLSVLPDSDYPVLLVHVTCPLEELRRREKERGDRQIGHGESLLSKLDPHDTYDITVDTFSGTLEECSDRIIELSNFPEKFTAFHSIWAQRIK